MSKSIKFNAGKVQYDEETHKCTPLPSKGTIQIKPSTDDPDFLFFTWTPKSDNMQGTTSTIESDELLLIPGDVSFKHITSCTTGRVFKLTFLSSGANHLYWFQDVGDLDQLDKLTEKDIKIMKDIEEMITLKDEDDEEEVEVKEEEKKPVEQVKLPITSLSHLLNLSIVEKHLDELSPEEIEQLYAEHLPSSTNPTKHDIIQLVRSGFFDQSLDRLNQGLQKSTGMGYILSQSLKFDYQGEGIEGFLKGIRQLTKKEEKEKDAEMKD